jgi:hypothetical protein
MRGIGTEDTTSLYLLELAPNESDPRRGSVIALPPVNTAQLAVIDTQPASDGVTLLHRNESTVTTSHITSNT